MRRLMAFAPLAALALIVVAATLALTQPGPRDTISRGLIGRPAPAYAFASLRDGPPIEPSAFRGRAYLINFFASWCAPCRVEHPILMQLKSDGVAILGVAYKDPAPRAAALLQDLGDPFMAVGLDPDGRYGLEIGLAGVPETFVVGADGRIRALIRGPLDEEVVRTRILPALREE